MLSLREAQFRHARHYRDVADESDTLYQQVGENVLRSLELFDRERTQIEAAFKFLSSMMGSARRADPGHRSAVSLPEIESANLLLALVDVVKYTSDLRFHPRQIIRWLEFQRDAARLAKNRQAEGWAIGNLGYSYDDLGEFRKAIEFYEQALVIFREIGDGRAEDNILGNLGVTYMNLGDARKAIEFYEQQSKIVREIGDRRGEGNALGNLGSAYMDLGDTRKAIDFYEQQLLIAREVGDRHGEGNALGNLGNAYSASGDARKAVEYCEQALVIDRETGDRRGEGTDLFNSGLALDCLGGRVNATVSLEAALKIYEAIEDPKAAEVRAKLDEWRAQPPHSHV